MYKNNNIVNFLLPIGITFILVIALIVVLSALDVSLTSEIGKVTISISGLLSLGLQYTLLYQVNRATAMHNLGISQKLEEYKSILQKGVEAEKTHLNEGLEEHKSILNSYLENHKLGTNKQLEDHKSGLQTNLEGFKKEISKELEDYKMLLSLGNTKNLKIYEIRLKDLTELYKNLVTLQYKLKVVTSFFAFRSKEVLDEAEKEWSNITFQVMKGKILLPKKIHASIDDFLNKSNEILSKIIVTREDSLENEVAFDMMNSAIDDVRKILPDMISKIEAGIRDALAITD